MVPRALDSKRTALCASVALAAASLVAGCTAVLGMPMPILCPDGNCADAPSRLEDEDGAPPVKEAGPSDAAPRPDADAGQDPDEAGDVVTPPAPSRCGGEQPGSIPACGDASVCCLSHKDGGASYTCTAENECTGYRIECAGPSDCSSGSVCCHFPTSMACTPEYEPDGAPGHCLDGLHGGDVVCDPLQPSTGCPTGSCKYPLDDGGINYGCWPLPQ
jgi:hypothetical protein